MYFYTRVFVSLIQVNVYAIITENPLSVILPKNSRYTLKCSTDIHSKYGNNSGILWWHYFPTGSNFNAPSYEIYNLYSIIKYIDYTPYYETDISKLSSVGLVIKNASENIAGIYRCQDANGHTRYSSVTVLLEYPFLKETKVNFNESIICCEVMYNGNISPALIIRSNETYNISHTELTDSTKKKICSNITRENFSISYQCVVRPNTLITEILGKSIKWDTSISINSDNFVFIGYNDVLTELYNNNCILCGNKKFIFAACFIPLILLIMAFIVCNIKRRKPVILRNYEMLSLNNS